MMPSARFERLLASHLQGCIRILVDDVYRRPPLGEEQIPAAVSFSLVHAGKDRAKRFVLDLHECAIADRVGPVNIGRGILDGGPCTDSRCWSDRTSALL